MLTLVLMILAIICFVAAALGYNPPRGGNLTALGLALWALAITLAPHL